MIYGLFITPFLITHLGTDEYGLYKLTSSIGSSLLVLNLGIGSTVQRYIALYLAKGERKRIENLVGMCAIITILLNIVIIIVSICIIYVFPFFYANTLSAIQIDKATLILVILMFQLLFVVFENLLSGVIMGFNNFIFLNICKIFNLLLSTGFIIIVIFFGGDSVSLALITLIFSIILLVVEWIYINYYLNVKIHFDFWDKELIREVWKYTLLMFCTAIASQIFLNADIIIIGAVLGAEIVTIYSVALHFFTVFQELSCCISGVMLPTITNALNENKGMEKVQRIVISAGRIQFAILGAAFAGIICIGDEFLTLWLGDEFKSIYIIIIILVGPSLFELCTNVCLSILRAENKIAFRTYVMFALAIMNVILTVLLVKYWSYMGAAIATSLSYIFSLIIMNTYYCKVIKLNIIKIYKEIVKRIWLCIFLTSICLFFFDKFIYGSWLGFIFKVCVFCIIYALLLLVYGLDKKEKKELLNFNNIFKV